MISIIGAGPSGNYLAYLLAKNNKEVNVYEEHNVIGRPIQCTGIVTKSFSDIIKLDKEFVVNIVNKAEINAPNKEKFELKLRDNIILDRHKFDIYLADKARDKGAKYYLNHRFTDCIKNNGKITIHLKNNKKSITKNTEYLVGADGPFSRVAKSAGLYNNRNFLNALQVKAKYESDNTLFQVFLHKDYFGWIVPENDKIARIGMSGFKDINNHFQGFMDKFIEKKDIIEYQSGLVPLYNPNDKISNGRIFLLGDAACQTKASTHGGIIQGLIAAEELNKSIIYGKDYDRLCKRRLGLDLDLHLFLREALDKFSFRDLDYLVKLTKQDKIKKILGEYDRDYPSKFFITKILLSEPRFFYFMKNLDFKSWKTLARSMLLSIGF